MAKGYDVDLIVSKVHQDLLDKGDIRPFDIPVSTQTIILKDRRASHNIAEIRKYLKSTDSRVVIAMSSNYVFALSLASIGLKKRPQIAYVEHSGIVGLDQETGLDVSAPSQLSARTWISRFINSRFNTIMAVSTGTARGVERINRLQKGKVQVVYNPVIDEVYYRKLSSSPQNPWLINKSLPTFIAAGAHSLIKNHLCLFKAIKLANEITPVRLVLFGKGELTETYKRWIIDNDMSERIMLGGHSSNLPAEINASDGLLVSSNQESFSIVLVEAMASNKQVISTACPYGPPELLQNGKFGTLVPVNDSKALAAAIVNQIKYPKCPAPREAWIPYTLENVVTAYEKALHLLA